MSDHQYIFREWHNNLYTGIVVMSVLFTLAIVNGFTTYFGPRHYKDSKGNWQNRRTDGVAMLVIFSFFSAILLYKYFQLHAIEAHCGITTGKITKKEWKSGRNGGWRFQYHFTAGNLVRDGYQVFAEDDAMKKSVVEDACYTVLYDTTAPDNAIMTLYEQQLCR